MGYGKEADKIFDTDSQITELVSYIAGLNRKVLLVGFSLGAQIAFKLVAEHEELFKAAIIVSPWLIKMTICYGLSWNRMRSNLLLLRKEGFVI